MGSLGLSLFINRPPAELFDYMTDPANDPLWQKQLVAAEWATPEPPGPGAVKRVTTRAFGRESEATAEYNVWERPDRYGFVTAVGPFTLTGLITLTAQDGGTLVHVTGQVESATIWRPLHGLLIRQIEKQDHENFNKLKELLETE